MDALFQNDSDITLLARLIYGEARGESLDGKIAVANVVRNRVNSSVTWWGRTWREVMLKPKQFSCFNEGDPNLDKLSKIDASRDANDQRLWRECLTIASAVCTGAFSDNTAGATHYHSIRVQPSWAASLTATVSIGRHVFYR